MKILCIHQGAELYGSDRSFALSIKTLREKYPKSTIVVIIPKRGELIPLLEPFVNEITIQDVGAIQRSDFKKPFSTLKKLTSSTFKAWKTLKDYDVIYMNTIVVFAFLIASIFARKVVIHHIREIPTKSESKVFSLLFKLNRSFLIFNSQYTMNSFVGLNRKSASVVLNGVKAFESRNIVKDLNTFNILIIGRINAWKGQLLAIEAFEALVVRFPHIRLRIVGSAIKGQEFFVEKILAEISTKKLEDKIEYVPFQSSPEENYYWADITLVPSTKPEPFGRVAIESLALGKPVIAANHGGLVEIIKSNYGGFLFNACDASDLAKKIAYLIEDEELLKLKSLEAKDCFTKGFSEEVYMENFKRTFEHILKLKKL